MSRTAKLEDHLSSAELRERYLTCKHDADRTRWHALWLVSLGKSGNEAAHLVGRTSGWVSLLIRAYNAHGPEGAKTIKREGRQWGGREACLKWGTDEERELLEALSQAAPDGGLWTAAKVASWLEERRGREVHMITGWRTLGRLRYSGQLPRPQHPRRRAWKNKLPFKKTLERLTSLRHELPDKRVGLCFQDEARFGLKPTYRRTWAPIGQRPLAPSRTKYEWSCVFASVHPESGKTHALILPSANLTTMQLYLDDFAACPPEDVIALLVLDGATWHRSPKLDVPGNLRLLFLPPYTPELNPAEHLWLPLREVTANRAFADIDVLESRLAERCVWLTEHPDKVASSTSFHGYQLE